MNDRIKQLAEQAGMYVEARGEPWPKWMSAEECELAYAKFAELIVRECLAQVDKVDTMLDDDKEKTGVAWVGLAIAKHFGVEPTVNETLRNRSTYFGNDI